MKVLEESEELSLEERERQMAVLIDTLARFKKLHSRMYAGDVDYDTAKEEVLELAKHTLDDDGYLRFQDILASIPVRGHSRAFQNSCRLVALRSMVNTIIDSHREAIAVLARIIKLKRGINDGCTA
jgi:hypothetical protein